MTATQTTVAAVETQAAVATPKSVAQRASRKRFSFGATWNAAVLAGKATDQAKLLAQALVLKAGAPSDLKKLKLATLRAKVAAKLEADFEASQAPVAAEVAAEVEAAPAAAVAAE
jgi:hypothetical protein